MAAPTHLPFARLCRGNNLSRVLLYPRAIAIYPGGFQASSCSWAGTD